MATLKERYARIPEEMRAFDSWCIATPWEPEPDEKPISPKEPRYWNRQDNKIRRAATNRSNTWMTFEDACLFAQWVINEHKHEAYLGYMFSEKDSYIVIDLDDKEGPTPQRQQNFEIIINNANSYTERSKSGKGYHIVVKADMVDDGRRHDKTGIEIYKNGRFVVITGDILDNFCTINPSQDIVDHLISEMPILATLAYDVQSLPQTKTDEDIIAILTRAKNSQKFLDLMAGNWEQHYPGKTHNSASLGLCQIIAFHTPNFEQVERIYKMSQLYPYDAKKHTAAWIVKTVVTAMGFKMKDIQMLESVKVDYNNIAIDIETLVKPAIRHEEDEPSTEFIPFPDPYPGVMTDIYNSILEVAPKPQPSLATLAALIGMSSACDGTFAAPCSGNIRFNLYGCGVAETGEGKDLPKHAANEIADAAQVRVIGKPGSGPGLEDEMDDYKSVLMEMDEIAHFFQELNGKNVDANTITISSNILRLFSASQGTYATRSLSKGNINKEASRRIKNPCLNFLGFATPSKLGISLKIENIEDGLIGRMIFAFGLEQVKSKRIRQQYAIPESVTTATNKLATAKLSASGFGGNNAVISELNLVDVTPEADAYLDELLDKQDKQVYKTESSFAKALFQRTFEKVVRIAGVLACWDDFMQPIINVDHIKWAESVLNSSNRNLMRFARGYMHGSDVQADAALVLKVIKRLLKGKINVPEANQKIAVENGMVPIRCVLLHTKLKKDSYIKASEHLIALEEIEEISIKRTAGNGKNYEMKCVMLRHVNY